MSEKIQKVLARVGLGSRRAMEDWIVDGRVSVNGKLATLGDRIAEGDELRVDGRSVNFSTEEESVRRVILYYKPEGEVCTRTATAQGITRRQRELSPILYSRRIAPNRRPPFPSVPEPLRSL